jgi:trimeric autotransporter adhesin
VTAAGLVGLAITPATTAVPVGFWRQLTATATYSDGTSLVVTGQAMWSSSAPGIASVSNSSLHAGDVTGLAVGTATVSAYFGGITATAQVTVTAATLLSIAVTPVNPVAAVGVPVQLNATGSFSDGSTLDITEQTTWRVVPKKNGTISNSEGSRGVATMIVPSSQAWMRAEHSGLNGQTRMSSP